MNPVALIDPDMLLIFSAVAASFLLGCVIRLIRGISEQRFEVAHTGADLRDLVDRCDRQHNRFKRIQDDIELLRQQLGETAALAQATAQTPGEVAAAARSKADSPPPPAAQSSSSRSEKADPLKLARAGASVETLMSSCKLSRAEAELVVSVHGAPRAA